MHLLMHRWPSEPRWALLPVPSCSALYFSSLLLLGIGLPAWAKPWKKWGKRKATQLPAPTAPATPAQEVADGAAAADAAALADKPSVAAAPVAAS